MKTIQNAMIEQITIDAMKMAHQNKEPRTVGKNNDYYITLEQLQIILERFEE